MFYHLNNTKHTVSQESDQLISAFGLINLINGSGTYTIPEIQNQFIGDQSIINLINGSGTDVTPPPALQLQQENNISTFFENNLKGMFYHLNMNNTKRTALPQELNISYASDQLRTALRIIELFQISQTEELASLFPIQAQEPENNTLTFVEQNFKDIFSSLKKIGQDIVIDSDDDSDDSKEERERERAKKSKNRARRAR